MGFKLLAGKTAADYDLTPPSDDGHFLIT